MHKPTVGDPIGPSTTSSVIATITVLSLCAIITGLITALATISFVEILLWLNNLLTIPANNISLEPQGKKWYWAIPTLLIPILAGLAVGLIIRKISNNAPHGILESIKAAHNIKPSLPLRDGLKSSLAVIISMGSGASVGHYGPIAHLGTTIGSALTRVFQATHFTGSIAIGCGAAAAIATAFNAPLAGIVFSHEVILRHYSLRSFAPIAISASTGYFMSHVVFERPLFLKWNR